MNKNFARLPHEISDGGFLPELKPNALRVYCVLLRHADYKTQQCYPTRRTIALKSGVTFSSISKATGDLEKLGLIEKVTVNLTRIKRVTRYQIIKNPSRPPAENIGRGEAEKAGLGAAENPAPGASGNLGHRGRDVDVETLEGETDRRRQANADPFSSIKCEHLDTGRKRVHLADAFEKFRTSSAARTLLGDCSVTEFWLKVQLEVLGYHETRIHRELPCDYAGCVLLPTAKIAAMALAKKNPLAYLAASLKADLGKEEDRALALRAAASSARAGSNDYAPMDSKAILKGMASVQGIFDP